MSKTGLKRGKSLVYEGKGKLFHFTETQLKVLHYMSLSFHSCPPLDGKIMFRKKEDFSDENTTERIVFSVALIKYEMSFFFYSDFS